MKKVLSFAELDSQTAMALPDREMMLVTVVITNLLNNNTVTIDIRNVNVAAQICANLIATGNFTCTTSQ